MILKSLKIAHFRCLQRCDIDLARYCPLVGPNGAGKSTILDAIRFVLDPRFIARAEQRNPDCSEPLRVTAVLAEPTTDDMQRFGKFMKADRTVTISRQVYFDEDGASNSYHITTACHAPFQAFRDMLLANENVPAKNAYNSFVSSNPSYGLPLVSKYGDIESALRTWEDAHPAECADVEQQVSIKSLTAAGWPPLDVIYVPAVKDASDDIDTRSPLQNLLDAIVTTPASANDEMVRLRQHVATAYRKIYPPGAPELQSVATVISGDLAAFAPGSAIELEWTQEYEPVLEPPPIDVKVVEDSYASGIREKGHGVQRAVILATISVLHKLQGMVDEASGVPVGTTPTKDVLLLIEEPELYQHPIRARHFADALRKNTNDTEGRRSQVIFSTHSPNFISLADFPGIRLLKRYRDAKATLPRRSIEQTTFDAVAQELFEAQDKPTFSFSGSDLMARLHGILDASLREGFFAESIVLVEGDNDLGMLIGSLQQRGFDYEALGLAVLAVNGKNNIDKSLVIFRKLRIPTYVIFDGDVGKASRGGKKAVSASPEAKANRSLLRLLGQTASDFPETFVGPIFSCFADSFDKTVMAELGDEFQSEMQKVCDALGYDDMAKARKVPAVFSASLKALSDRGIQSEVLSRLCDNIEAFAQAAREAVRV